MKYILTILLSLSVMNTYAMPKYLEGASVTVTLKNGKTYEYKSEEMAVVPRNSLGKLSTYESDLSDLKQRIENKSLIENKKNRVSFIIGSGPTGELEASTDGSEYSIDHKRGTVKGVSYQRKIDEQLNIGIQHQSNDTTSLSIGVDF